MAGAGGLSRLWLLHAFEATTNLVKGMYCGEMLKFICGVHDGLASYQAEKHCIVICNAYGPLIISDFAMLSSKDECTWVAINIWAERFTNHMATFVL